MWRWNATTDTIMNDSKIRPCLGRNLCSTSMADSKNVLHSSACNVASVSRHVIGNANDGVWSRHHSGSSWCQSTHSTARADAARSGTHRRHWVRHSGGHLVRHILILLNHLSLRVLHSEQERRV